MGIRNLRVTQTISRAKIRYGAGGVLILLAAAAFFAFPQGYDRFSDWFKNRSGIDFGHFPWNVPYRLGLDLQGGTHLIYEAETSDIPPAERSGALEGVRDVIERRVNAFGVSEPVVQTNRSGERWRVIVELAGVKDVKEAIKMIGETPILEFKEEAPQREMTAEQEKEMEIFNQEAKKKAESILKKARAGANFAALAKQYSEDAGSASKEGDLNWFGEGVMVKPFEETVKSLKEGEIAKTLTLSQFGYHNIKKTGEREIEKEGKKIKEYRASHILFKTKNVFDYLPAPSENDGWQFTGLTGKQLQRSTVQFDPNSGLPTVGLEFNDEGKQLFAAITERNVGKQVAIFLDGLPISAPVVNEPIREGKAVISGNFTMTESKQLSQRLNAGALPVPVTLVSQQTVGASLGMASLEKSLTAGLIGFAAVAFFMILFYRLPGFLAALALLLYAAAVLSIFKLIPVTLTLAGMAGFILSVGMAVDANILIFERTKEELRRGLSITQALNEGFGRAWLSIRDSNVSSLLTCLILMWFGTSLIKGFALTLSIGIIASMFSAITVTRILLHLVGPWIKSPWWLLGPRADFHKKAND